MNDNDLIRRAKIAWHNSKIGYISLPIFSTDGSHLLDISSGGLPSAGGAHAARGGRGGAGRKRGAVPAHRRPDLRRACLHDRVRRRGLSNKPNVA